MTLTQEIITIGLCVLGTVMTRFLPFLIFSPKKPTPKYIQYLGKALPCAVFGMLIVYSLKDVSVTGGGYGIPEVLAVGVTVLLHKLKGQMLLSIAGGTLCYMLMVQLIF